LRRRVVSLHGDLPQSARDAAVASLRAGACDVLVATDVAARGLDLPGVELVVHADPPKDADAYAHRAGRAGRPGCAAPGVSLLLQEPGAAATAATASLEFRAKIRLRRLSAIGERAVTERSVAAARAAWEEKQREGGRSVDAGDALGGDGGGVEALGPRPRQSHKKTADPADETSFARLGERSLMDDRFDELSVDLASIRGKQKGKGRGRGKR
jgi:superfamily II DNA/RNA helicase